MVFSGCSVQPGADRYLAIERAADRALARMQGHVENRSSHWCAGGQSAQASFEEFE
jgi:hypothetical protein